jgi:demethylmenaquinone methyltransferase/2-methoxy-6-polyprenyl-1,4-benzoquinol methylase
MIDFATREEVLAVYRKRARNYDLSANLYYFLGFQEQAYRRIAVEALRLRAGDTVVEIGCGTGLNFSLLQKKIGRSGKIIGVDLTDAMLRQAADRIERNGWSNVELVQSDAASYRFPDKIDGILSTFALTLEPDYDGVIARGAKALKQGKRWVVLDVKLPTNWLRHLAPLLIFLVRPFAVSMEVAKRHPWESIERRLTKTSFKELYFGVAYVSVGEAA